ncbi:hypothetical protein L218DRAFT_991166, partial [Marasmius fiardii PR-910]
MFKLREFLPATMLTRASGPNVLDLSTGMLRDIFGFCVDGDVRIADITENPNSLDLNSPPSTLDITKSPWVLSQ